MGRICIDCGYNRALEKRKICAACKSRRYRIANPVKAAFNSLKFHAKARGKDFDLTLEQFEQFCVKTEYHHKKGRHRQGYHVDRIDETKGYTIDNIQAITNSQNVRKYISFIHNPCGQSTFKTFTTKPAEIPDEEDCPF